MVSACFFRVNRQHNAQARILLEQAVKIEKTSALLFAIIGWTHLFDFFFSWSESPLDSFEETEKFAKKILEINPSFSLEYYKNVVPLKDRTELERYIENLRKAGLPE